MRSNALQQSNKIDQWHFHFKILTGNYSRLNRIKAGNGFFKSLASLVYPQKSRRLVTMKTRPDTEVESSSLCAQWSQKEALPVWSSFQMFEHRLRLQWNASQSLPSATSTLKITRMAILSSSLPSALNVRSHAGRQWPLLRAITTDGEAHCLRCISCIQLST